MKVNIYFSLLKSFYYRMKGQNTITVIVFVISVLTVNAALSFYFTTLNIKEHVTKSFYEYKSINISEVRKVASNNDLITLNQYRRPQISTLVNIKTRIGNFEIKPDYRALLNEGTLRLFNQEVVRPEFVVHHAQEIGINETFYNLLLQSFKINGKDLTFNYSLNSSIIFNEESFNISVSLPLNIQFIYEEINYFNIPKLFIPQQLVDTFLGEYSLDSNLTVADFIYLLPNDHQLTNRQFRLHFDDEVVYKTFIKNVLNINHEVSYEFSGDNYEKAELFDALFTYLRLLVIIFLVLVMAGVFLITVMLTNAFVEKNKSQIALFELFNVNSPMPNVLFNVIYFFNYSLSFMSLPLSILIFKYFNLVINNVIGITNFLTFNYSFYILIYFLLGVMNFLLLTIVTKIKLRKPIISTLLAHD